jgi:four helix bundle protein
MTIKSHRDLEVWQLALDLAVDVYRLTRAMLKSEEHRLSAQMIRASASIPANLAEGNSRGTRKDYAHFASIARGSTAELETFLIMVDRLDIAPKAEVARLIGRTEQVGRMLNALRSRLAET